MLKYKAGVSREHWDLLSHQNKIYRSLSISDPDYSIRAIERYPVMKSDQAMITIHGMEEDWDVFESALEYINEYRSLRLDMPWTGTNGYEWTLSSISLAQRLQNVIQELPVQVNAVIAHSFGTSAVFSAIDCMDFSNLQALVLMSPFFMFPEQEFNWQALDYFSNYYQKFLEIAVQVRMNKTIETNIKKRMADHIRDKIGPLGCMTALYHYARTKMINFEKFTVPTLIIVGEHDFYCLPQQCQRLATTMANGHCEVLANCGHFSMIEQPQRVGRLIADFLEQNLAKRVG